MTSSDEEVYQLPIKKNKRGKVSIIKYNIITYIGGRPSVQIFIFRIWLPKYIIKMKYSDFRLLTNNEESPS